MTQRAIALCIEQTFDNVSIMLRCSRCQEAKPSEDFAWRRIQKGQRDTYCRPCRAAYKQEHYAKNKRRYIQAANRRNYRLRVERTEWLVEYFRSHPCVDCGEGDPVVLDFDHLRDKSFNIGRALNYRKWSAIVEEIAKCEVVCSNCHRRRTARRRNSMRLALFSVASRV